MIDKDEMAMNAKAVVEMANNAGVRNLGCVVVFFDTVHGNPCIATNVDRDKLMTVLHEIQRALPSLPVIDGSDEGRN